jgi:hypothetical protein
MREQAEDVRCDLFKLRRIIRDSNMLSTLIVGAGPAGGCPLNNEI